MLAVIIVAAGSSRRMGFDKLMAPLLGKPVLWHTVQAFLNCDQVSQVILVSTQERYDQLAIQSDKLSLVAGGNDRHDSVANGIAKASQNSSMIAVHDGARPLISNEQIIRTLTAAEQHGAATSARRVTETVKRSDDSNFSKSSVSRDNLWLMETPQIFNAQLLRKAYSEIEQSGKLVTDEVSALEHIGTATFLVENTSLTPNIKITYPHDLNMAELFLQ